LLTCVNHFLINQKERAQAQRRGGGQKIVPLEVDSAETQYSLEPADNVTPEVLFERRWAMAVLEQTLREVGEEYARRNQSEIFNALKEFLPGGQVSGSRSEVAARFQMSASAVDVAIHRLCYRFGAALRANKSHAQFHRKLKSRRSFVIWSPHWAGKQKPTVCFVEIN
jgi:RNA polymerase sigma-70 factor (ECF subfamily)